MFKLYTQQDALNTQKNTSYEGMTRWQRFRQTRQDSDPETCFCDLVCLRAEQNTEDVNRHASVIDHITELYWSNTVHIGMTRRKPICVEDNTQY